MDETLVPLTETDIKSYLDGSIAYWRRYRMQFATGSLEDTMGLCYTDAYQSVRASLFGELLQPTNGDYREDEPTP